MPAKDLYHDAVKQALIKVIVFDEQSEVITQWLK
jgi:hypothetical protein